MVSTLGTNPTFGFGDRLGLATEGHCQALLQYGGNILGIFAQQSIREMGRTNRTPQEVMDDAAHALFKRNFEGIWGADADHLKTTKDVDLVFDAGFTFFTIDPSGHVDDEADKLSDDEVLDQFGKQDVKPEWINEYLDQEITLDTHRNLELDEVSLKRCALKYGNAITFSIEMGLYILKKAKSSKREIEIEMSIDETEQPTTGVEHFVFADQLLKAGLPLVSIAPRFVGNFEKGVDFFGDRDGFEETLKQHAAIARRLGGYKLSLHSGSDKLSIYEVFARETRGRFHVKTAGTSYLEALHVIAATDEPFFRKIVEEARSHFAEDRATYHLSTDLSAAIEPEAIDSADDLLHEYIVKDSGRQILHVTFGSILRHPDLGVGLRFRIVNHSRLYEEYLTEHFRKHLEALTSGLADLS